MNLESILAQVLDITGTFNPKIAVVLFLICAIGEAATFIPYVLETIWMLTGYQLASGVLSPFHFLLIWITSQLGRQTGAIILYNMGKLGSTPIIKLYKKYFETRLASRPFVPKAILNRVNALSPFPVALGRLVGLRIPLTLTLSVQRRYKILSLAVLFSSIAWDGVYVIIGNIVGATVTPKPLNMILYSLIGLTILYLVTFIIRLLYKRFFSNTHNKDNKLSSQQ